MTRKCITSTALAHQLLNGTRSAHHPWCETKEHKPLHYVRLIQIQKYNLARVGIHITCRMGIMVRLPHGLPRFDPPGTHTPFLFIQFSPTNLFRIIEPSGLTNLMKIIIMYFCNQILSRSIHWMQYNRDTVKVPIFYG